LDDPSQSRVGHDPRECRQRCRHGDGERRDHHGHGVRRSCRSDYPGDPDAAVFAKGPMFARVLWPEAVEKVGLPKRTGMHTLRRTYASALIAHQAGPKTVAARLGDTVEVAMATYAHLFPDEDQGPREAVEDFLGSAPDVPCAGLPGAKTQVDRQRAPDSDDPPFRPNQAV
jgi:integrase